MPEPKSRLGKALAAKWIDTSLKLSEPHKPWTGPDGEGPNGGITQGMIGKFLVCRERFKVKVYDGLGPVDRFNALMEYGNFWHAGEEAYKTDPTKPNKWLEAISNYYETLRNKYPMDREAITHWWSLCREQFPIYIAFWAEQKEEVSRTRLLSEQAFDVPYKLPYSQRVIRLRGKWDGVDLISSHKQMRYGDDKTSVGVWLQENKTKSSIDHVKITRQLKFDLQTMLYLIAWDNWSGDLPVCNADDLVLHGVRYNVVKRSAHKSAESMVKKIYEDMNDGRIGEWFARWNVPISDADIHKFKRTCLDPVLEQICLWWKVTNKQPLTEKDMCVAADTMNYRTPYGVYNSLDANGEDIVDEYLNTGSTVGLHKLTNLFPELQTL